MIDVLALPHVLDAARCAALRERLRAAPAVAATVYGQDGTRARVDPRTRATTRLQPDDTVLAALEAALHACRPRLEAHFALALSQLEPLQCLRYDVGGFFVAHQDGNTPLLYDDTRFRRVSVVLFLSSPGGGAGDAGYEGGELVLHPPLLSREAARPFAPDAGTLLAFRSETTHEVLPVRRGERFTVAGWWR